MSPIITRETTSVFFCLLSYQKSLSDNSLRKHAYSNILRILPPKNENFQMKNSGSFHISAQNIARGYLLEPSRRGGSKYHSDTKVGFKGIKTI